MRAVVTRVRSASVTIDDKTAGQIGVGFLVLLGVHEEDTEKEALKIADKICGLRIFEDENGKTNLDLASVGGSLLMVSQFTLYANCKKGNRPSFIEAGLPEMAEPLFGYIVDKCREGGTKVETGEFGALMKVSLINDGPFTIVLDSDEMGWQG